MEGLVLSDYNFVTHLSKEFTDKYGKQFVEFFVNESIYGKYLSAADIFKMQESLDDVILPEQSNFTRDFNKNSKLCNAIINFTSFHKVNINTFFKENKIDICAGRNSEKSYYEILFSYICFRKQLGKRDFSSKRIEECRKIFFDELDSITKKESWYNESIAKSIVWSIEFFRLRLFLEDMNDDSFVFTHVLDWFDIFEFRILPVALKKVKKKFCKSLKSKDKFESDEIINLLCKKRSDYPFSERLGIDNQGVRRALWGIRKNLLPQKMYYSDVNLSEDIEIFNKLIKHIRKISDADISPIEKRGQILVYTSERNRLRNCFKPNGAAYTYALMTDINIGLIDSECMDICIDLFKNLTLDTDINNYDNIISVIGIHHLIYHELLEEEKDDCFHPRLSLQKKELEYSYHLFQKQVLDMIFYTYTDDKTLLMDISLSDDFKDVLLSEMIMLGSKLLKKNTSDTLLKKVYESSLNSFDVERNRFINQVWNSIDVEGRAICCLHVNDIGKLERINCTDEIHLSVEEKEFAESLGDCWITELENIHKNIYF